ncbi:MAG TPA: S53 family peptidase [Acidobacteriaceae bacterium]|nr:S53 family peptidase [Acidobacteriaceae bacterium]
MRSRRLIVSLVFAGALTLCMAAPAQQANQNAQTARHEADRVIAAVDTQQRRSLSGHLPPWAAPDGDLGAISTDVALDHLTVVLARSTATQAAFEQFLNDQQNPGSPHYQQWLTPQQLGEEFGPTDHDMNAVTQWLASEGLRVDAISPDHMRITFSGASGAVGRALSTEFHRYRVYTGHGEEQRLSISSEPTIPAALAPVIAAFHGLSEEHFEPQSILHQATAAKDDPTPLLTGNCGGVVCHVIAPADFVTIFDMQPAYNAGFNGSGERVAIIGQSRVLASDITAFQTDTGLSATAQPVTIIPNTGTDPGIASSDQPEQTLDANRVMGTATGAEADLVVSAAVGTTDGLTIAMEYEVDTLMDPIMTISYGSCEAQPNGSSFIAIYNGIFSTAAAEGITTFVASGDSGAAACVLGGSTPPASTPVASINLLCASQYVTCVGGTEFADTANPSLYWQSSNGAGLESAISYIPEGAWNEPLNGSAFQIAGTGGGPSMYVSKPSWQTGTGVPADGARDTPDMSFPAAVEHDGYITCLNNSCAGGSFEIYGGTSLDAPGMAGIMALVVQKMGKPQGNFNPTLYSMAASPALGVFHDATPASSGVGSCSVGTASMCNNSTPGPHALTGGLAGYALTTGYDLATGWGSVDVGNLLAAIVSSYTLTPASGTLAIASPGMTTGNTYTLTATSVNSFAGTVPLSCMVTYNGAGTATDPPTCSLSPSSAILTANGTANTTVTIHTTVAIASNSAPKLLFHAYGRAGGVLACILLCLPLGVRRDRRRDQRRVSLLFTLLAILVLSAGLNGCGAGVSTGAAVSNPGTTLGNYTVTVSGTFAGTVTSTSFTLTVN